MEGGREGGWVMVRRRMRIMRGAAGMPKYGKWRRHTCLAGVGMLGGAVVTIQFPAVVGGDEHALKKARHVFVDGEPMEGSLPNLVVCR